MILRIAAGAVLALFFVTLSPLQAQMRRGPAPGPAEVGVVTATTRDVPFTTTLPGRAVAWQTAEIRPRVSGVIAEILYQPGRPVATGDVLFRIEDDTYRAALTSAEAAVRQAYAAIATAEASLKRAQSLVGVGSTQATLETAELTLAQAEAASSAAEAQAKIARFDLERTLIRSPIDGVVDVTDMSIGSLVTANQTDPLTIVRRIDPIYIDVAESGAAMSRNRDRMSNAGLVPGQKNDIRLTLEDGSEHESLGEMVSRGSAVSTTTGTTLMRFSFDNPQGRILPGQFLRVELTLGSTEALLVPQRATSRSADGRLTAYTIRDGRAVSVPLTEVGVSDNAWLVTAGLSEGEPIIVDGLNNLREGAEVIPVQVSISADGVVTDLPVAELHGN